MWTRQNRYTKYVPESYYPIHRCLDAHMMAHNYKGDGYLGIRIVNPLQYKMQIIDTTMLKIGSNVAW